MKNEKVLTLQEVKDNTIWVAKMIGYRLTGTYDELEDARHSDDCRDFDVCCTQETPELQKFWDDCWKYEEENHCWKTIDEFYEIWING